MLKGYLISGIIEFSLFAIVLIIRKLISDEGLESFLIYFHKKDLLLFCKGAFYGIIFFLIYPITIIAFGLGQLGLSLDKIYITLEVIFMDIFNCFMIALFEESLFRGYILQKLLKRFPMWISVGISSIIFGALHYNSYSGASNVMIGLINASLIGIILSIAVIKTNSLMLALGYHLTWNLAQDVILNKGRLIFSFKVHNVIWCGSYGYPETGLIVTSIILLMFLYLKIS